MLLAQLKPKSLGAPSTFRSMRDLDRVRHAANILLEEAASLDCTFSEEVASWYRRADKVVDAFGPNPDHLLLDWTSGTDLSLHTMSVQTLEAYVRLATRQLNTLIVYATEESQTGVVGRYSLDPARIDRQAVRQHVTAARDAIEASNLHNAAHLLEMLDDLLTELNRDKPRWYRAYVLLPSVLVQLSTITLGVAAADEAVSNIQAAYHLVVAGAMQLDPRGATTPTPREHALLPSVGPRRLEEDDEPR